MRKFICNNCKMVFNENNLQIEVSSETCNFWGTDFTKETETISCIECGSTDMSEYYGDYDDGELDNIDEHECDDFDDDEFDNIK